MLVNKEYQMDVAKEHRIGISTVSRMVNKAVKNKQFIDELVQMQQVKLMKVDTIAAAL